jgi:hypothetical protein
MQCYVALHMHMQRTIRSTPCCSIFNVHYSLQVNTFLNMLCYHYVHYSAIHCATGGLFGKLHTYIHGVTHFKASSIYHVLKAKDLDPENAGLFGTRTLRYL